MRPQGTKKGKILTVLGTVVLFCMMSPGFSFAHEAGNVMVRVGAATVSPNDSSGAVTGLAGSGVGVNSNTQLGLTLTYMLTDNIGLGLLAATPFSHTVSGTGTLAGVTVGKAKHLPPTLTVQYHFGKKNSTFNPYVGVGVNYTVFFSDDADAEVIAALGANSAGLSLSNSFGLAAEAGVDVKISDNWFLNAAVWYIDIDTTATLTPDTGIIRKVDVDIDPWVFMVGFARRF